jgi:hypothetical protein
MTVVEVLDQLFRKIIGSRVKDVPLVTHIPSHLIFEYEINMNGLSQWQTIDYLILIKRDIIKYNDELHYKIFRSDRSTGKISFYVTDIKDNTPSTRKVDVNSYQYILKITVMYKYLPVSYLDLLPKELDILILSKIDDIADVQNSCKAEDICSGGGFWTDLFKLRYPNIYRTYIKLNLGQRINKASYLLYLNFNTNDNLTTVPGQKFWDIRFSENGEIYWPFNINLTGDDKSAVIKIVSNVIYPLASNIISNNTFLSKIHNPLGNILLRNRKANLRSRFPLIYPMIRYIFNNQLPNTIDVLLNTDELRTTFGATEEASEYFIMYTILLMLNFTGLNHRDKRIMDTVMYIVDGIEHLDAGFMAHDYSYDRPSMGSYPMLRDYMNKIKSENMDIYNAIMNLCKSPSQQYVALCERLNEFVFR